MRAGEGTADVTLVEFLLARIAERERIAEAAAARVRRWPKDTRPPWVRARAFAQEERHAALEAFEGRETPGEVLAECQARRAIIELHEHVGSWQSEWYDGDSVPFEGGQFGCRICALDDRQIEPEGWCATLRALAGPFKGHPDFDAGWSPK